MEREITYEQTIELEENIKIKNKADELYRQFLRNIKLDVSKYKGDGKFLFWNDEHNSTYFVLKEKIFVFQCRFLHESYDVEVTPSAIFRYLKSDYRGINHFAAAVRDLNTKTTQ